MEMDKQQLIEQYGNLRFTVTEECDIYLKAQFGDVVAFVFVADRMLVENQKLEAIGQLIVKFEGLVKNKVAAMAPPMHNVYTFPATQYKKTACT